MTEEVFTFTEAEVKDLSNVIREQARVPKDAQENFCGVWPQAKVALQLLKTFIGIIPGVGPFARVAIGIVLVAGDAASSAVCQ
jgi:hypothetical protein